MNRGLIQYSDIRCIPMRDLTMAQCCELEISQCIHEIRQAAQAMRMATGDVNKTWKHGHLRYLIGMLHGVVYGYSTPLIYKGGHDYIEPIAAAAMNEANFLCDEYGWSAA